MTTRPKMALSTIALVSAGVGLTYAALLMSSSLPARAMDRDSSGMVSFGEALDARDVGVRPSAQDRSCTEYYWLKDGTLAHVSCAGAGSPQT
jgi:hypothetical protein